MESNLVVKCHHYTLTDQQRIMLWEIIISVLKIARRYLELKQLENFLLNYLRVFFFQFKDIY